MASGIDLLPGGALIDPNFDQGDLLGRQFRPFWRHDFIWVRGSDSLVNRALGAVGWGDSRFAGFSALEGIGLEIDAEFGFLGIGAVAFTAAFDQEGFDLRFEISGSRRAGCGQQGAKE